MQNIDIKGLRNTRDLGGLPSAGTTVRKGLLLRGGHLHDIRPREAQALQETYRLRYIIDLRTELERSEKPDQAIPGATYRHMPIMTMATVGITHEQASDDRAALIKNLPDMCNLYANMVTGESAQLLSDVVHLIVESASAGGAVLYHCTEGKDRTGIVSLVLLSMLGVPHGAILQDYLFTNEYSRKRARRYYWLVLAMKRDRAMADKVRSIFMTDESYLNAAVQAIQREWGGMQLFISNGLHITASEQEAFAKALLYNDPLESSK